MDGFAVEVPGDADALPSRMLQLVEISIEQIGDIGLHQSKLCSAVNADPNTVGGGTRQVGGMLCAAAGAAQHAFISARWGEVSRSSGFDLAECGAGGGSDGDEQQSDGARDGRAQQNNFDPYTVCLHNHSSVRAPLKGALRFRLLLLGMVQLWGQARWGETSANRLNQKGAERRLKRRKMEDRQKFPCVEKRS